MIKDIVWIKEKDNENRYDLFVNKKHTGALVYIKIDNKEKWYWTEQQERIFLEKEIIDKISKKIKELTVLKRFNESFGM